MRDSLLGTAVGATLAGAVLSLAVPAACNRRLTLDGSLPPPKANRSGQPTVDDVANATADQRALARSTVGVGVWRASGAVGTLSSAIVEHCGPCTNLGPRLGDLEQRLGKTFAAPAQVTCSGVAIEGHVVATARHCTDRKVAYAVYPGFADATALPRPRRVAYVCETTNPRPHASWVSLLRVAEPPSLPATSSPDLASFKRGYALMFGHPFGASRMVFGGDKDSKIRAKKGQIWSSVDSFPNCSGAPVFRTSRLDGREEWALVGVNYGAGGTTCLSNTCAADDSAVRVERLDRGVLAVAARLESVASPAEFRRLERELEANGWDCWATSRKR